MARFSREHLESFRDATVPDLIGDECRLMFVGINPGLWTAATQTHFCHPSNRFYPALRLAGLIDWEVDTMTGMTDQQREAFVETGLGITNLVRRATVRASELKPAELKKGGVTLKALVEEREPVVVAVAGVSAYRIAFDERHAELGPQSAGIGRAALWVVPNPSGLNAHETVDSLAGWYRKAGRAAGTT
ncbi:MAG: mismatch-specific DNA-glycosylase [Acidimicrobiia bacterium]